MMSDEHDREPQGLPAGPNGLLGLSASELFAGLSADALRALQGQCEWRRFDLGEAVLSADLDRDHGVYFVVEGAVDLFRDGDTFAPVPLTRIAAGEYFGEFAAVVGTAGSVSARAAAPSLLAEIPRAAFVALLSSHPHIPLRLLERQVSLIRALNERLSALETRDQYVTHVYSQLVRATL